MELSERLRAVAGCVTKGLRVADIGCDHGYTAIYLIREQIAPHVYAMDVNKGPLEKAAANVAAEGLWDKVTIRLSNGLEKLYQNEAECILISGMGGLLMKEILSANQKVLRQAEELVLQPQSEIGALRHFLHEAGFSIVHEKMVVDMGKYYTILKAVPGLERYDSEKEYEYGRILLKERAPVFLSYLQKERERMQPIAEALRQKEDARIKKRYKELRQKLVWINEVVGTMQTDNPVLQGYPCEDGQPM